MNTYIQDKLDEFDEKVNNTYEFFNATDGGGDLQYTINEIDIDGVRDFIQQSLTDYHNHIVEILEKERQTWAKESIGEVAVKSIINRLQDTNPKE